MQVTFVLLDAAPPESLEQLNPDRDWREFVTGERAWILQTYLRLKRAGCAVQLAAELPSTGIAVFSSKHRRALRNRSRGHSKAMLVGVRQDVGEALIADFEVVQNKNQSDDQRRFYMPHWPQPGLIERDPSRGTIVKNISFKGFSANLTPDYAMPDWFEFLASHDLAWQTDSVPHQETGVAAHTLSWNDFRDCDVVLAVRPADRELYPRKPATKLYNAWLAGVPAILGPEIAYRELRKSALDYIEVANRKEAQDAILKLKHDAELYRAMVENGRKRAVEFTIEAIVDRWRTLLFDRIPALDSAPHVKRWRGKSLWRKEMSRRLVRAVGLWS